MNKRNELLIDRVLWSNVNDLPDGYDYNNDGYVITDEKHLCVKVVILPFLKKLLGEYQFYFQNIVATLYLNPTSSLKGLKPILEKRFTITAGLDKGLFYKVWKEAIKENFD